MNYTSIKTFSYLLLSALLFVTSFSQATVGGRLPIVESWAKLGLQVGDVQKIKVTDNAIIHYLKSKAVTEGYRVIGGSNWLANATKQLAAEGIDLYISTGFGGNNGLMMEVNGKPAIFVSPEIINIPNAGVLYHERVHALASLEHLPTFNPAIAIVLVSPNKMIKVAGYESILSSDEFEAFREGAQRSFAAAKIEFQKKDYETAYLHTANADSAVLYMGIYRSVTKHLLSLQENIKTRNFKLVVIDAENVAVEPLNVSENDVRVIFRVDAKMSESQLVSEILKQTAFRLESYKNAAAEIEKLKKELVEFKAHFYPALANFRKSKKP